MVHESPSEVPDLQTGDRGSDWLLHGAPPRPAATGHEAPAPPSSVMKLAPRDQSIT
jgi:hypothetical protein